MYPPNVHSGVTWEASTLPLSYTRKNRIYFNPKNGACTADYWCPSCRSSDAFVDKNAQALLKAMLSPPKQVIVTQSITQIVKPPTTKDNTNG